MDWYDVWMLVAFVAIYLILLRVVLPRFGVPT